jgi:hypothetical protein
MTPIRTNVAAETPTTTLIGLSFAAAGELGMLITGSSDVS